MLATCAKPRPPHLLTSKPADTPDPPPSLSSGHRSPMSKVSDAEGSPAVGRSVPIIGPPPVPPRRRKLFQRKDKTPAPAPSPPVEAESSTSGSSTVTPIYHSPHRHHESPSPLGPNSTATPATSSPSTPSGSHPPAEPPNRFKFRSFLHDGTRPAAEAVRALGHGLPSSMRSAGTASGTPTPGPSSPLSPGLTTDDNPGSRPSSRPASIKATAAASTSRVRLDVPDVPPPPLPRQKRQLGHLYLGSRSTPDLGAAKRAQSSKSTADTSETSRKKKGRVSLGALFRNRSSTRLAKSAEEASNSKERPPLPAMASSPAKSAPTTPVTPTFRCPSCSTLHETVATPRAALSPRPTHGPYNGRLSRPSSHSALRSPGETTGSLRGPPNARYNSVYRYGHHSGSLTSMSASPLGMSLSQTSLTHSRSSLHNGSRTSLNPSHSRLDLLHNPSHTSLSLSQTSLVLPDSSRNQLLSKDHYHLRFATTYIINLISPALRSANFAKSERNMEIKRITEDRLAMLQRMERTWGSSWSDAAAELLNGTQSGVSLEVQEAKLRACNITATAKARERKVFVNALRDGIIFCFLFNRLFPAQPAHIQRVKVPKDDVRIKANIDRFLAACREVGVPESEMFSLSDLDENLPAGLACVERNILVLAQMSGLANVPRVRVPSGVPSASDTTATPSSSTPLTKVPSQSGPASRPTSPRSSGTTPVANRTFDNRPLRSSSSDLLARLQRENGNTSSGSPSSVPSSSLPSSSVASSSVPSAENTTSKATSGGVRRPSLSSVTPPMTPVRIVTSPSTQPAQPAAAPSTARPQVRATNPRTQVSFASDASSPRSHEWTNSVSSTQSVAHLAPLQERSPPAVVTAGVTPSERAAHERTPQERSQLQERERTPSLVSASSHVASSYSRSSMSGSGFTGPIPAIVGENVDDFHPLECLPLETSPTSQSPEARSMSEHTLQEARRKIIGTLLSSTEDLTLTPPVQDDARGVALSQSLAALEGASRPPLNTSRSESPRLRPISRGLRAQSIELNGGGRMEDGSATPQRPASELPPRPRIRRPSVNGKVYVPKRPSSPASPSLSLNGSVLPSPVTLMDHSSEFGSRILSKEERRRSADFPQRAPSVIGASRIMNMRNQSMVNLPSRRASTLSQDSMVHGSMQVLEFVDTEAQTSFRYQLGNCIGRGQFGAVYRSLNLTSGQMVAIKRIRLSGMKEKEVRDVMREVELLQRLSHPGIVKYEGMSRDDKFLNIVLEFVENGSLGQTLKAFGKFNERLVASYVAKILEGLHYLHSEGVVHCDLKAANILSTKNGNIKLSDFGVSLNMRAVENFAERASIGRADIKSNEIAGTPNWMAPEIIKLAGASPASDIWSLGCTIIELISGRPPYSDVPNSMTVLFRIVEDPMPPMPETSPELQDFLKLCFVKEPTERPTAAMLWEHEWVREGKGDLISRPQDSLPFLRRLSQEPAHHRVDAQRLFSPNSQARSASASYVDLGTSRSDAPPDASTSNLAQMSMVSLHAPLYQGSQGKAQGKEQSDREPSPEVTGGKAHALVKTSFAKPITCHVCLQSLRKQALLCQNCGLITHSKCSTRAHPRCDVREQLALLAHHQDRGAIETNSPYAMPEPPSSLSLVSLPARIFGWNKSKSNLFSAASTTSLVEPEPRRGIRRYSSGGGGGGTSPGPTPSALPSGQTTPCGQPSSGQPATSANDTVGSYRSRHSESASEDNGGTGPRNQSTSLLRIDEDVPAHKYDRQLRVEEPIKPVRQPMLPPVENAPKRRPSLRRPRSGDVKGDCVVQ